MNELSEALFLRNCLLLLWCLGGETFFFAVALLLIGVVSEADEG